MISKKLFKRLKTLAVVTALVVGVTINRDMFTSKADDGKIVESDVESKENVDGLYEWYTFNKGNCYLTFGYRAGGLQIKYMEMGRIEE